MPSLLEAAKTRPNITLDTPGFRNPLRWCQQQSPGTYLLLFFARGDMEYSRSDMTGAGYTRRVNGTLTMGDKVFHPHFMGNGMERLLGMRWDAAWVDERVALHERGDALLERVLVDTKRVTP